MAIERGVHEVTERPAGPKPEPPKPLARREAEGGMAGVFELSPETLRAAVQREQRIREVLKEYLGSNMEEGRHLYWLSERDKKSGRKPSLTKEGAFNLAGLFKSRPVPQTPQVEYHADGHFTVITRVDLLSLVTGEVVGTGDGLCTTRESKYAYRWAWPSEVPEEQREGKRTRSVRTDSGRVTQYAMPNPDLADQFNTVLKMSFKRGAVAAALTLPVASELLTQDLEDLAGDEDDGAPAGGAPEAKETRPGLYTTTAQEIVDEAQRAGKSLPWLRALAQGTFRKVPEEMVPEELGRLLEEVRKHTRNGNGKLKPAAEGGRPQAGAETRAGSGGEPAEPPPAPQEIRAGGEVKPSGSVAVEPVRGQADHSRPLEPPREAKPTARAEAPWDPSMDTPEQKAAREATMARIYAAAESAKMGTLEWRGLAKTIYGHEPEQMPVDMLALLAGRLEAIARGEGLGGPESRRTP